jgi:hypothetical protein
MTAPSRTTEFTFVTTLRGALTSALTFALLAASPFASFAQDNPRWDYEVPESERDYAGERFIIIGDSLSTEVKSWASILRTQFPSLNLHNWAQGRRSIVGYKLPPDIISKQEPTIFILGSNDYWASDAQNTRAATRRLLQSMIDYNMNVLVFLPPYHPKWYPNSPEYKQTAIRNAIKSVADSLEIPTADLADIWDSDETTDGIHPNDELSFRVALWVYEMSQERLNMQKPNE